MIDRQTVYDFVTSLLPTLEALAKSTETKVDDTILIVVRSIHESEMAQEWVANWARQSAELPEGVLASVEIPDEVRLDILRRIPDADRQGLGDGRIIKALLEKFGPVLIEMLLKWITKTA